MQAGWADASRIERVPRMTAFAKPFVFFAGRPAAERAADARGFRFAELLLVLSNDGRIINDAQAPLTVFAM